MNLERGRVVSTPGLALPAGAFLRACGRGQQQCTVARTARTDTGARAYACEEAQRSAAQRPQMRSQRTPQIARGTRHAYTVWRAHAVFSRAFTRARAAQRDEIRMHDERLEQTDSKLRDEVGIPSLPRQTDRDRDGRRVRGGGPRATAGSVRRRAGVPR